MQAAVYSWVKLFLPENPSVVRLICFDNHVFGSKTENDVQARCIENVLRRAARPVTVLLESKLLFEGNRENIYYKDIKSILSADSTLEQQAQTTWIGRYEFTGLPQEVTLEGIDPRFALDALRNDFSASKTLPDGISEKINKAINGIQKDCSAAIERLASIHDHIVGDVQKALMITAQLSTAAVLQGQRVRQLTLAIERGSFMGARRALFDGALLADAVDLLAFLQLIDGSDERKILFAGGEHAKNMVKYLKLCGFVQQEDNAIASADKLSKINSSLESALEQIVLISPATTTQLEGELADAVREVSGLSISSAPVEEPQSRPESPTKRMR